ncbi:hypothetical protein LA76x_1415 [Lysobacter antibioticus]|uniref:Uncharacterized protein n=1 Tax=Lysobacter antibioticus TaxID=84531 RepID=A0A0S2F7Y5_LYSAN|nr:hypothetical protein LA76x_1415 [Lysobacter antibioticus]
MRSSGVRRVAASEAASQWHRWPQHRGRGSRRSYPLDAWLWGRSGASRDTRRHEPRIDPMAAWNGPRGTLESISAESTNRRQIAARPRVRPRLAGAIAAVRLAARSCRSTP